MDAGIPVMLSKNMVDNPNFTWANDRTLKGAMVAKKATEVKKLLLDRKKSKKEKFVASTPDLFADL